MSDTPWRPRYGGFCRHGSGDVGVLDLDDAGAEAREQERRERPGEGQREVEDGEALERQSALR